MKRFVIGDIHGGYKALMQCLERSNFDYENDLLISLGDIVDGWSETYECVEELLKIKNLIAIKGNHDDWFLNWIEFGSHPVDWLQGAHATAQSYIKHADREIVLTSSNGAYKTNLTNIDIPKTHIEFFKKQIPKYVINENGEKLVFVHGGFNRHRELSEQTTWLFYWDRNLFMQAYADSKRTKEDRSKHPFKFKEPNIKTVFVGHTTTQSWNSLEPIITDKVINLDTGGGWSGKLTIMDIDTKEFWQSDLVKDLYSNEKGRNE